MNGRALIEPAIVSVAALAIVALLVAPLATPYWWDAGAVYAPGAKWLLDHGFDARPGVFPSDLSRGHTSLFYVLLAASYRVLGAGPVAGHLVTFAFAWIAVVFTYALGRRLFDWQAGTVAAVLLVVSPLFQTMASEALPEMAMTALTAASFHAFARGRITLCAALGTLLVLVKEVGVACPLAIAGAVMIEMLVTKRMDFRRIAIALVPVLVLALFFAVQKRAEGWFVLPYHAGLFHEQHSLVLQLARVAESIFVADGRWIAVLSAAAIALWHRADLTRAWREHRDVLVAFVLFAVMNLGFFAKMFFLERYVLPVHVIACVLIGGMLTRARWPGLAAAAIAIGVALSRRSAGTDMASGETTFRYLHAVHAHAALLHRLESGETAGDDPLVLTVWPVTDELREPFLGWVHRRFRCVDLDNVGSPWRVHADRIIAVEGLGSFERLRHEAHDRGFSLLDRAEEGGAAIELWGP